MAGSHGARPGVRNRRRQIKVWSGSWNVGESKPPANINVRVPRCVCVVCCYQRTRVLYCVACVCVLCDAVYCHHWQWQ